jgi:hypothetical protein
MIALINSLLADDNGARLAYGLASLRMWKNVAEISNGSLLYTSANTSVVSPGNIFVLNLN